MKTIELSNNGKHNTQVPGEHSEKNIPLWQAAVPDVLLRIQRDVFQRGYDRGVIAGDLESNEGELDSLEEHARSIAREAHRELFDPTKHAHDQLRDAQFQKYKADLAEAELAGRHADAIIAQREEELAQAQASAIPPKPPVLIAVAAITTLTVSSVPTLHDFIFVMADEFWSWLLSLFGGLFWGVLVTVMILFGIDVHDGRGTLNWIGVAAGIGMSLALGAIRLQEASSLGEVVFAIGLTALEIFIVLGLEAVASRYRPAYQEWAKKRASKNTAEEFLKAAIAQRQRWREKENALKDWIKGHIDYVEERAGRFNTDQIEDALVKAIRDGYQHGIKASVGKVRGIKVAQP